MTYRQRLNNQLFVTDLNTLQWKGQCSWTRLTWAPISSHVSTPLLLMKYSETRSRWWETSARREILPLFPAVVSTSEKEIFKATLSHVSTSIFWAAGLVKRAVSKALLIFTSFQKKTKQTHTHSSVTLGLLSLIVIIETFLVIYGTRGLLGTSKRESKELLNLPRISLNKNLSPSSGFRRRKLYFASPCYNVVFQWTSSYIPPVILRAHLKSKSPLECNS